MSERPFFKVVPDGQRRAEQLAAATGLSTLYIKGALLQLWEDAWKREDDRIGLWGLLGLLQDHHNRLETPVMQRLINALESFGFLETLGPDAYRIKGAAELHGFEARRIKRERLRENGRKGGRPKTKAEPNGNQMADSGFQKVSESCETESNQEAPESIEHRDLEHRDLDFSKGGGVDHAAREEPGGLKPVGELAKADFLRRFVGALRANTPAEPETQQPSPVPAADPAPPAAAPTQLSPPPLEIETGGRGLNTAEALVPHMSQIAKEATGRQYLWRNFERDILNELLVDFTGEQILDWWRGALLDKTRKPPVTEVKALKRIMLAEAKRQRAPAAAVRL